MATVSSLTYQGALKILGAGESRIIKALDVALGAALLALGPAAWTGREAASFLWGAIDQKSEAVTLLHKLVSAGSSRLSKTNGRERLDLIQAAHTTLVGAAFFEAWQEELGPVWKDLEISQAEKLKLLSGGETISVFQLPVPMPSPTTGLSVRSDDDLGAYLYDCALAAQTFFAGLAAADRHGQLSDQAVARAVQLRALDRYRTHFLRLAGEVREFLVWVLLSGQAELYDQVAANQRELTRHREGLARLTELLRLSHSETAAAEQVELVRRANAAVVSQPMVSGETLRYVDDLRFPSIADGYVTPGYQFVVKSAADNVADDEWWNDRPTRHDLDVFFAAHFGSVAATEQPLLVLGDPGAGKSTLSKVLAARLPADRYLVVRVPLRDVTADALVHQQVQDALDLRLGGRVQWSTLAGQTKGLTRVVILDGLDELIQSVGVGRRYLDEVARFQQSESAIGSPVCAVVTSRTLVTGQTWLPRDCQVLKLAEFTDDQIAKWLRHWRTANREAARAGRIQLLAPETTAWLPDLARQPLLLLLIALYVADPTRPALAAGLSEADLYGRLIDNFIRREIDKAEADVAPADLENEISVRRWHLGIAAMAMFNRRRTYILDRELIADLDGLNVPVPAGGAYDIVGRFFFIHAASAKVPRHIERLQSFEFLHSTFGEYLVAVTVLEELRVVADRLAGSRPGQSNRIDDDLLFALISWVAPDQQSRVLTFLGDLAAELTPERQQQLITTGYRLISAARRRITTTVYDKYRPQEGDAVRAYAAYTANLVLLLVRITEVPISRLASDERTALTGWQSMVRLWHGALDEQSWRTVLSSLAYSSDTESIRFAQVGGSLVEEWATAELLDETLTIRVFDFVNRLGGLDYAVDVWPVRETLLSALLRRNLMPEAVLPILADQLQRERLPSGLTQLIIDFLGFARPGWNYPAIRMITELLVGELEERHPEPPRADYRPLGLTAAAFPELLTDVPRLTGLVISRAVWDTEPMSLHFSALSAMSGDPEWRARLDRAFHKPA